MGKCDLEFDPVPALSAHHAVRVGQMRSHDFLDESVHAKRITVRRAADLFNKKNKLLLLRELKFINFETIIIIKAHPIIKCTPRGRERLERTHSVYRIIAPRRYSERLPLSASGEREKSNFDRSSIGTHRSDRPLINEEGNEKMEMKCRSAAEDARIACDG